MLPRLFEATTPRTEERRPYEVKCHACGDFGILWRGHDPEPMSLTLLRELVTRCAVGLCQCYAGTWWLDYMRLLAELGEVSAAVLEEFVSHVEAGRRA